MTGPLRSARTAVFLGVRALTRGPLVVLLMTVAMMALVYVQLLFIPSLIQGAVDHTEEQLIDTATSSVQVTPAGDAATIPDADGLTTDVSALSEVEAVASTLRIASEISVGSASGSWPTMAIDPEAHGDTFETDTNLVEGRWLRADDTDAIVLGIGVAGADVVDVATYRSSLRHVHVGDIATVPLPDGTSADLTVVGIYRNRLSSSDGQAFVAEQAAAQMVPSSVGQASTIYVRTTDGREAAVARAIEDLRDDVATETWLDQRSVIEDQIESFDLIKQILRVVSLLVAAVTVLIVTYVDLVGKRRTIGIERAIGIRSSAIVASYVVKAVAYALVGIAVGAGLFMGVVVPLIDRNPFPFPIGPVTLSVRGDQLRGDAVVLVIVAIGAAVLPAWRSVRIQILDAIWG